MFDLPVVEDYEKKEYATFRKQLLKNGYIMMQFSIYTKPTNIQVRADQELKKISKYLPSSGNIRLLAITEKQYSNMVMILGKKKINEIYNNTERYIKI